MLLNMAMIALDGNDWSNNATNVTTLMQEKLEQIRTDPPPAGTYSDTVDGYSRTWRLGSAGSGTHLVQATVKVDWTDVKGHACSDSISSLILKP
jgi:hypothetical protein